MKLRQTSGRGVYGASIVLGVLAISEIVFLLVPRLRPLTDIFDLVELFLHRIDPGLKWATEDSALLRVYIALALTWLAAWVALEAFSKVTDGVSVWRNISQDSCGTVRNGIRRLMCTLPKWMLTFASAPLLILWALVQRLRHGQRVFTVLFITINPTTILGYIKHIALGVALVFSLGAAIGGAGQ